MSDRFTKVIALALSYNEEFTCPFVWHSHVVQILRSAYSTPINSNSGFDNQGASMSERDMTNFGAKFFISRFDRYIRQIKYTIRDLVL